MNCYSCCGRGVKTTTVAKVLPDGSVERTSREYPCPACGGSGDQVDALRPRVRVERRSNEHEGHFHFERDLPMTGGEK